MEKRAFPELLKSVKQMGEILAGKRSPSRVWYLNKETGERILLTAKQAKEAISNPKKTVAAIRESTRLSQADFATLIQVSVGTLRNWEQGRREPTGPARALMAVLAYDPTIVIKALRHRKTQHAKRPGVKQKNAA